MEIKENIGKLDVNAKRKGYNEESIKLTDETKCAKILLKKRVNTIKFKYAMARYMPILNHAHSYYNIHWNKYVRKTLDITVERSEKEVSDNAKALAALIINKELGEIEPYIIYGNIKGNIKLSNRLIEYTMYRKLTLGVNNIVIDILLSVEGDDKVNIIENIDEVVLDRKFNINKKTGWKLIHFKYKSDIITDDKVINELKKLIFEKIQDGVKYEMSIFEGYDIVFREKLNHHIRQLFWYGNNRSVTFGVIVNFEKKVKDVKYGVLSRI
jgi:hypothetical protein